MELIDKMMLLWYIEIDFLCIEGVALKKNFIIILTLVFLASLSLYGMAHGGRTDEDGGHYDHSTGEYHYHHGYSAHQHEDGECPYDYDDNTDHEHIKPHTPETTEEDYNDDEIDFTCEYIDIYNLEDVLRSEFEGELADEIRDAIAYAPDTKSISIGYSYYVEYESLWDISMRQYGEEITDRIFFNPNLVILSPEDIADRHDIEEYEEADDDEGETYSKQKSNGVIDVFKEVGIGLAIMFGIYGLVALVDYIKSRI